MSSLLSCSIIEKDTTGDVLWSWTFPTITQEEKESLLLKFNYELKEDTETLFGRTNNKWFYMTVTTDSSAKLPLVQKFAVVLLTKDFNPEKYGNLCAVMAKTYCMTGNPAKVLQVYLRVLSGNENGSLQIKDLDVKSNYGSTRVGELIRLFNLEFIIIYTAVLLSKRVIVYHHHLPTLLQWITSFPSLVPHRNRFDNLFPWVDLIAEEVNCIKDSPSFIMGCYDNGVLSFSEFYDVLVNLPAKEVTISGKAKESFAMTKLQKDIAVTMVQMVENNPKEGEVIAALNDKTQNLISQLRSISTLREDGQYCLAVQTLRDKNVAPAMEAFLTNLARSENMLLH